MFKPYNLTLSGRVSPPNKKRIGVGTIEESRRNRQAKQPKKSPENRVYRPYGGFLFHPYLPTGKKWHDSAMLRPAGYLFAENWLIGDLSVL